MPLWAIPLLMLMLAGFFGLGYVWFGVLEWTSRPGQYGFGAAGLLYSIACSYGLHRLAAPRASRSPGDPAPLRAEEAAFLRQYDDQMRQRIAELRRDPRKARFIHEVERGYLITDRQIEYRLNPEELVTCEHLRPVEAAMKAADLRMRVTAGFQGPPAHVECECVLDEDRLRRDLSLADCAVYEEWQDARGEEDASLRCTLCGSTLHVWPTWCRDRFPVFPKAGSGLGAR